MFINRGVDKEDGVHMYKGTLLSHKKEPKNAICSNMGGRTDYHTKWSKSERQIYHLYVESNFKKIQRNLSIKQKQTIDAKIKLMITMGVR